MKRKISLTLLLLSLLLLNSLFSYSQENSKISPYIQLQYFKDNDENSYLKTTLTYSSNRMELPLPGMKIIFYSGQEKKAKLTEITTDDKGVAIYNLNHKSDLLVDKNGLWPFSSVFDGNDTIASVNSELLIRDVTLIMTLTEADSIKTIGLIAKKKDKEKEISVSGETVMLYVPRMFSLLPIGEAKLDETGSASVEFPSSLPGDKEGNVTIIARFEEHPEFGNVEKRSTLKWGLPPTYAVPPGHRALWTKTAPRWMIYTLSVLLSGVWGHYLFAIISLIRIRMNAKKKAKEEYRV
jgi:ACT domain-containing protein